MNEHLTILVLRKYEIIYFLKCLIKEQPYFSPRLVLAKTKCFSESLNLGRKKDLVYDLEINNCSVVNTKG